ncbi:MAG: hypothetical protein H6577_05305 [Lewinellaceae bacterium]|nr:hypothetical protein [Saprospiraceae bacterium]MCB9337521.1 hypothetical protein [Lewinellaceae bacterium]
MIATKAFDEFIDLIAAGTNPAQIVAFKPSLATIRRVEELLFREKDGDITPEEKSELDDYLLLEHILRLVKVRARKYLKAA